MGHLCIEVRLVRIFQDFLSVYLSSPVHLGVGVKCTELFVHVGSSHLLHLLGHR